MRIPWSTLLLSLLLSPSVTAFEYPTTMGNGLGQALMLSRSDASTLLAVPAGGIRSGEWTVDAGYSRMYELSDLDRAFVAGVYRAGAITMAVGLAQLGHIDFYAERTLKGSMAIQYDSLSVAVTLSGLMVDISQGYGRLRAATVGVGAAYRSRRWFVAFSADNLTSPKLHPFATAMLPQYHLFTELIGKGRFSLLGRASFQKDERPDFAFAQTIDLSSASSVFWGISARPLKYGGGMNLHLSSFSVTYTASVHPVLGFTHTISFSYGSAFQHRGGETFDQPN